MLISVYSSSHYPPSLSFPYSLSLPLYSCLLLILLFSFLSNLTPTAAPVGKNIVQYYSVILSKNSASRSIEIALFQYMELQRRWKQILYKMSIRSSKFCFRPSFPSKYIVIYQLISFKRAKRALDKSD